MRKRSANIWIAVLAAFLMVITITLVLMPWLSNLFAVEVSAENIMVVDDTPLPDKPEQLPVTVYYVMEEKSKKISSLYIEVFSVGTQTVYYMEIPDDVKITLSEGLYKSLQTYGPELPQHLKLANVPESFSEEYGLTAANRIISEVLGISVTEYVRTSAEVFQNWLETQKKEKIPSEFFEAYSGWLEETTSSRTAQERWSYYESRLQVTEVLLETAPGSREKDGFRISSKRTKERLEEMMRGAETEQEE